MVRARKLVVPLLLLGGVLAAVIWWSGRDPEDGGSSGIGESGSGRTVPQQGEGPEMPGRRRDGGSDPAGEALRETVTTDAARTGQFIVQVDEVDQCIDPAGTALVLITGGQRFEAVVQKDGGAFFRDVPFDPGGRLYALETAVPDRACFPQQLRVTTSDLEGNPPAYGLSLALVHLHALQGTVRDATSGDRIAGARVAVDSFVVSESTSDAEGRYELNLPDPRGTLLINAPGYQELAWHFPEETDAGTWLPDRRDFALLRDPVTSFLEIEGVLPDGSPAAGAELEFVELGTLPLSMESLDGMTFAGQREFIRSLEQEVDALGRITGAEGDLPASLDERGRARVRMVLPLRARVILRQARYVAAESVVLNVGDRQLLQMDLIEGVRLRLTTIGDEGSVAGVRLRVDPGLDGKSIDIQSDDDGVALVRGLIPGSRVGVGLAHRNDLAFPYQAESRLVVLPEEGGTESRVELRVRVLPLGRVAGRLVDAETARGIRGWLRLDEAGRRRSDPTARSTEDDGSFDLGEVALAGSVTCGAPWYRQVSIPLAGFDGDAKEVRLTSVVGSSTRLDLTILDDAGVPLQSGDVWWTVKVHAGSRQIANWGNRWAELDAQGTITIQGELNAGEELVASVRASTEDGEATGTGFYSVRAGERTRRELQLVRVRAGFLGGRVLFHGTAIPVPGAQVSALGTDVETDREGRFTMSGLQAGPVRLVARWSGYGVVKELTVPEDGLRNLEVHLRPLSLIRIDARDAVNGVPVRNALVSSSLGDSRFDSSMLVPAPVGQAIDVTVGAPGYVQRLFRVDTRTIGPNGLVVELERDS